MEIFSCQYPFPELQAGKKQKTTNTKKHTKQIEIKQTHTQ
jgi:hypothetical protein